MDWEEYKVGGRVLQNAWPSGSCYGCGPANPQGLHIHSHWSVDGSEIICTFEPKHEFNAGFPNVMYGGLVASLIDCHSIWTAIAWTYRDEGREHGSPPSISYVTGTLTVRYLAPTPLDRPVVLRARVTELQPRKALVECGLYSGETRCAEGAVTAVRFTMDKALGAD
jgi:acyl-coenzyme A thioesterase PaaI-like protein